jgi:iron complex outermembrane receptor protein
VKRASLGLAVVLGLIPDLGAQNPAPKPIDLGQASLEVLMDIKVTSVSKKEEKLSRTAAAIFVISSDDIRRSGATNIPDLLRMAPGVDVEQIDANAWAISIRGFNSRYSDKVLVLIDGRTVYNPTFSGVSWDQLELPLEDIDRIEVIRGPGASVWGANAVNGVISIITKSSKDTKGGLLTVAGGSQTNALGELQYGGAAGQSATYRVFASYFDIGNSDAQTGGDANDHWQRSHAGFRTDWQASSSDSLMLQGDLFANQENQTAGSDIPTLSAPLTPQPLGAAGGDLLALWKHTLAGGSETSFRAYFNNDRIDDVGTPGKMRTFDLDFQHHLVAGDRNDIVWGLGARSDTTGLTAGYPVMFVPPYRTVALFNVFFQDEIRVSNALWFTIGGKLEHNGYTGFEVEPSARLVWAPPDKKYALWAAASKAIREPSQTDVDVQVDLGMLSVGPGTVEVFRLLGNPKVEVEQVRDYEFGFRSELTKALSFDAALFLSFYHDLETLEPQTPVILPGVPGAPVEIEIPLLYENQTHAMDYGGELFLNWRATSRWRISPGYSYLHATLSQNPPGQGINSATISTDFPQNLVQVRSLFNLSRKMDFDQSLYYTARLAGGAIPGHARLDVRLARRIGESAEISVVGQNLLQPRALEYGNSDGIVGTESVRSVYGKITWRF